MTTRLEHHLDPKRFISPDAIVQHLFCQRILTKRTPSGVLFALERSLIGSDSAAAGRENNQQRPNFGTCPGEMNKAGIDFTVRFMRMRMEIL